MIVAIGDTSFAAMLKPIMDQGFVDQDTSFIAWVPVILLLIALFRAIGEFIDAYCMNWVARQVIHDLRQLMFEKLVHAPASYFDHHASGSLVSRLTFDVEQVARASSTAFRVFFKDLFKAIFLLGWMFYLSWELSLIFSIILPLSYFIFKYTSRRFRKISTRIQESVGDITHISKEALQGHRVVKVFNAFEQETAVFKRANNRNRQQAMKRASVLAASVPLMVFILGTGVAVVIWLALLQEISPGVFSSYLLSMTMLIRPLKNLSKVNEVIQTGIAGAQSIFKTLDLEEEKDEGSESLDTVAGNVRFENVSFEYESGDKKILDDISFEIPAGSTVALVGKSGSGKSTIASLLLRFYQPTKGEISLDNHPLDTIRLSSLRQHTAIVTQEITLFDQSVRDNIAYGQSENIDSEKLASAADAAHVTPFVEKMAEGFDTLVGEQGTRLSGGQRQRIAIARALYKDAPILILDEATSSLDSQSEQQIQQAIDRLIENRTTLVIAHRLSTIERADLILVLDEGRIVERGTHHELIKGDGLYVKLHKSQFNSEPENDRV